MPRGAGPLEPKEPASSHPPTDACLRGRKSDPMNASSEPQADTAGPLTPSSRGATDTCTPTTGDTDGMLTTNTCSTAPPQSPYDPFEPATGKPQTPGPQEPSVPGVRPRLTYLDLTRGLIMVVMCWDHVKDLVHQGGGGPEPPEMWYAPPKWTAFPAVFFWLRWVSHFCAPGFFYTMGMGMTLFCAARLRRGWTMARICRHYATRAAVLFLVGRISDFGFGAENLVDVVEGWKVVGWISGNVHGKVSLGEALWQLLFGVYQVCLRLPVASPHHGSLLSLLHRSVPVEIPPLCESNAIVRATVGIVSAILGSVQDINRLTCFRNFWSRGIWRFLFLVVHEYKFFCHLGLGMIFEEY